ncbi:unnamed protein product [Amoebophrya sp. A25]|nr:unnamed protein product [Amoebophrya sp. A25]|eukprot:GSA25T00007031001.1
MKLCIVILSRLSYPYPCPALQVQVNLDERVLILLRSCRKPKINYIKMSILNPPSKTTRAGDWDCPGCGTIVFASKDVCFVCKFDRSALARARARLFHPGSTTTKSKKDESKEAIGSSFRSTTTTATGTTRSTRELGELLVPRSTTGDARRRSRSRADRRVCDRDRARRAGTAGTRTEETTSRGTSTNEILRRANDAITRPGDVLKRPSPKASPTTKSGRSPAANNADRNRTRRGGSKRRTETRAGDQIGKARTTTASTITSASARSLLPPPGSKTTGDLQLPPPASSTTAATKNYKLFSVSGQSASKKTETSVSSRLFQLEKNSTTTGTGAGLSQVLPVPPGRETTTNNIKQMTTTATPASTTDTAVLSPPERTISSSKGNNIKDRKERGQARLADDMNLLDILHKTGSGLKIGDWVCHKCHINNFGSKLRCFKCSNPKGIHTGKNLIITKEIMDSVRGRRTCRSGVGEAKPTKSKSVLERQMEETLSRELDTVDLSDKNINSMGNMLGLGLDQVQQKRHENNVWTRDAIFHRRGTAGCEENHIDHQDRDKNRTIQLSNIKPDHDGTNVYDTNYQRDLAALREEYGEETVNAILQEEEEKAREAEARAVERERVLSARGTTANPFAPVEDELVRGRGTDARTTTCRKSNKTRTSRGSNLFSSNPFAPAPARGQEQETSTTNVERAHHEAASAGNTNVASQRRRSSPCGTLLEEVNGRREQEELDVLEDSFFGSSPDLDEPADSEVRNVFEDVDSPAPRRGVEQNRDHQVEALGRRSTRGAPDRNGISKESKVMSEIFSSNLDSSPMMNDESLEEVDACVFDEIDLEVQEAQEDPIERKQASKDVKITRDQRRDLLFTKSKTTRSRSPRRRTNGPLRLQPDGTMSAAPSKETSKPAKVLPIPATSQRHSPQRRDRERRSRERRDRDAEKRDRDTGRRPRSRKRSPSGRPQGTNYSPLKHAALEKMILIKGKYEPARAGDWPCPNCGLIVFASKDECFKCKKYKRK